MDLMNSLLAKMSVGNPLFVDVTQVSRLKLSAKNDEPPLRPWRSLVSTYVRWLRVLVSLFANLKSHEDERDEFAEKAGALQL